MYYIHVCSFSLLLIVSHTSQHTIAPVGYNTQLSAQDLGSEIYQWAIFDGAFDAHGKKLVQDVTEQLNNQELVTQLNNQDVLKSWNIEVSDPPKTTDVEKGRKNEGLSMSSLKVPLVTLILVKLVNLKLLSSLILLGITLIKKALAAGALFVPVLMQKLKHGFSKEDSHVYVQHEHVDDGQLYHQHHRRYYYPQQQQQQQQHHQPPTQQYQS